MKLYDRLLKIEQVCARGEKVFSGFFFSVLILAGFTQVMFRYVFHLTVAWAEELILICLEWCVFVGASAATTEKKHIIISVLVDMFPEKVRKWFTVFSQVLWLIFAIATLYITYDNTLNAFSRGNATLGGGYPYWIPMAALPVGLFLMVTKVIVLILKTIHGEADLRDAEEVLREEMVG